MRNTKIHPVQRRRVAWGLRLTQKLCVSLARGYQWRMACGKRLRGLTHATPAEQQRNAWRQQRLTRTVVSRVYAQGVLQEMSADIGLTHAMGDIRAALQANAQHWSMWLSLLTLASYALGALLGRANETGLLPAEGVPMIFLNFYALYAARTL